MKDVTIPRDLAITLMDLLKKTIEYDTSGEPIDSDHAFWLDNLIDLEDALGRS